MRQDFRGTGGAVRFASGPIVRIEEWAIVIDAGNRLWSGELTVHAFVGDLPYDHDPATVTLVDQRHGSVILTGKVVLTSRRLVTEMSTRCQVQGMEAPKMYP